ncbi:MAG: hypothetical protein AABW82_02640 [Nanoarchaeota archaeon]
MSSPMPEALKYDKSSPIGDYDFIGVVASVNTRNRGGAFELLLPDGKKLSYGFAEVPVLHHLKDAFAKGSSFQVGSLERELKGDSYLGASLFLHRTLDDLRRDDLVSVEPLREIRKGYELTDELMKGKNWDLARVSRYVLCGRGE